MQPEKPAFRVGRAFKPGGQTTAQLTKFGPEFPTNTGTAGWGPSESAASARPKAGFVFSDGLFVGGGRLKGLLRCFFAAFFVFVFFRRPLGGGFAFFVQGFELVAGGGAVAFAQEGFALQGAGALQAFGFKGVGGLGGGGEEGGGEDEEGGFHVFPFFLNGWQRPYNKQAV